MKSLLLLQQIEEVNTVDMVWIENKVKKPPHPTLSLKPVRGFEDLCKGTGTAEKWRKRNSTGVQNTLAMTKPQGWLSRHSQFLTYAVNDYAPYTFLVIYHSFYLPSHSTLLVVLSS